MSKLRLIKQVRDLTGMSLMSCKAAVESMYEEVLCDDEIRIKSDSLRDLFAAAAMINPIGESLSYKEDAEECYRRADAMVGASKQTGDSE